MTQLDIGFEQQFTIFIVDDDPDVRDAVGLLLELQGHRTALFGSAEEFLAGLEPGAIGCIIADIRMPGMNGLELQQRLAGLGVELPVVVLTAHADVASARTALRAHAVDFLTKPFKESDLTAAIQCAVEQERARFSGLKAAAVDQALVARLTPREREVAAWLATGAQNIEIAKQLGISTRTVEIHKARCMEKLDLGTLADLVRLADRTALRINP